MNNWFNDDAPVVGRIFFADSIVQTYSACSAVISGSNGKSGVVVIVRTTELDLPLGNSVVSWVLYLPAVVVCWIKLSIWFWMFL